MVAVRPPEYFPGLAYAALMAHAVQFVMADTFQYSRQSFQNRTRVRNSQGGQWVTVPLKGGQHGRPQLTTRIRQVAAWRKRHWKAFLYNYSRTPFFAHYEAAMADFFASEYTHLAEITCASVMLTHRLLSLRSKLVRASALAGQPTTMQSVLRSFPENTVLLPSSSACIDRPLVPGARILRYTHPTYRQAFEGFEPGMTVLDLLFNYGPESLAVLQSGILIREN